MAGALGPLTGGRGPIRQANPFELGVFPGHFRGKKGVTAVLQVSLNRLEVVTYAIRADNL